MALVAPEGGMSALDRITAVVGHNPTDALRRYNRANKRLHELKSRAAGVVADLASLRAQFYGGETSNFNHERKVLLAELMEARRAEQIETGQKVVEAALERYAYAHPIYKSWLVAQHERRERMHRLEAELAQIEADAEAAVGERRLAEQAIRMNEELIRWSRAEMGMAS